MPSLTFLSSSVFLVLQHHQNPLLISWLSFSFITQLSHTILNFWSMLRNEVYRATRPTEDTITTTLLTVVLSYTRLLFVDFNLPHKLVTKLTECPVTSGLTFCLFDSQKVRVGCYKFSALSLSTGSSQGCVLSPYSSSSILTTAPPSIPATTSLNFQMTPL